MNNDQKWSLILGSTIVLAAITARRSMDTSWKATTDRDLPDTPRQASGGWPEALGWAALTGAIVGVTRMITQTLMERWHR